MSPIVVHVLAVMGGLEETNIRGVVCVVVVSLGAAQVVHGPAIPSRGAWHDAAAPTRAEPRTVRFL